MVYRFLLLLLCTSITACTEKFLIEEISDNRIYVVVRAGAVIETDGMDQRELENYILTKARKRASSILISQYMYRNNYPGLEYRDILISSCLTDEDILYLKESGEYVTASVSFRMKNCEDLIEKNITSPEQNGSSQ